MSCDIGEVTERLENEHFTYITAHSFASPTSQDLHLRHLASHPWCGTLVTRSPMGLKGRALNQAQIGGFLSYKNPRFIKAILKYSQN